MVPALIYWAINKELPGGALRLGHPHGHRHRFRIGRAGLLGKRGAGVAEAVPDDLAIIDDLGAIASVIARVLFRRPLQVPPWPARGCA